MRTGRVQDVEDGLSECPHVIVNQARIHDHLLGAMLCSPSRLEPDYGLEVVDVVVGDSGERPVTVLLRPTGTSESGAEVAVRAKYVVGCDGARSAVRRSIGCELRGDAANHGWGVMDILAVTDFPDIRLKAAIQSGGSGNILLIPREGGFLVRLYVDLGEIDPDDREAVRATRPEQVIAIAQRVLRPYTLDVKEVAWFSVYEVGQRLTDRFDDVPAALVGVRVPRVFIAGDACHTHSAKAGLGMNVSMQDTFNLGWKLAAVLEGRSPESLLDTYSAERQAIARELIDFDREWSAIMASPAANPDDPGAGGVDPSLLQEYFVRSGRYTAGVATRYTSSPLAGESTHQHLAEGFPIGMRFHSAPVIRLADAKPVQLGHAARADGRWRLYAFADTARPGRRVVTAARALRAPRVLPRLAGPAIHADRCRPRQRARRARRPPTGTPRARASPGCRPCSCRARAATGSSTTRRRSPRTRARTSSTCVESTASTVPSSSCAPTSTSPTCCPSTATRSWRRSSPRSCSQPGRPHVRECAAASTVGGGPGSIAAAPLSPSRAASASGWARSSLVA